jgi:hypothetical protein
MTQSIAYRVVGPTAALSVANTQHAAVAILPAMQSDQVQFASFISSGGTTPGAVCVVLAQLPATGTAATPVLVFPVDGTPTVPTSFILPPNMTQPIVVAVPQGQGPSGGFSVSMIGLVAGPTTVYVTPLVSQ